MSEREDRKNERIAKQCTVLSEVILSIRPVYTQADPQQRALIETMIGAAIWYLPKPPDAWTGFISLCALQAFHPSSGLEEPKFSEEHLYPRKIAARRLLEDDSLCSVGLTRAFKNKYGRLHYITPEENKSVQPFQRSEVFLTPEEAYKKAGIVLIEMKKDDLSRIKKREQNVIERYLNVHRSK